MKSKYIPKSEIYMELSRFTPKGEPILERLRPDINGNLIISIEETDVLTILKWLDEKDPLFMTPSLRKAATDMREATHDLWQGLKDD